MKTNSDNISGQLIDVIIVCIVLIVFLISVLFLKTLLYKNEEITGEISVVSELLDKKYYGAIKLGDALFDNVSKRRIGYVTDLHAEWHGEARFRYFLTLRAERNVLGRAMRNASLWFEYTDISYNL